MEFLTQQSLSQTEYCTIPSVTSITRLSNAQESPNNRRDQTSLTIEYSEVFLINSRPIYYSMIDSFGLNL